MPVWKNSQDDKGVASSPPKPLASWYAQGLSDGLGDRLLMFDNSDAPSLELLRFRPDFAQVPGFETALRERVQRLGHFRHPAFARVRSVQRLEPDDDLALISNCTPGKRLSDVLHRARGPAFVATLIRQLAPALVLLQQHDDGIFHGVLSADRIVVSPDGRLTIVEHVVGPAIDALNLGTAQLASIGIALPPAAMAATQRLDVSTDWYQLGLVAVSVLLGRQVTASELSQIETLLDGLGHSAGRDGTILSPWTRQWLDRALQISSTRIESGADARAALDELLRKDGPGDSRRVELLHHEEPRPRPLALSPVGPAAPREDLQPPRQLRTSFDPVTLTDFPPESELQTPSSRAAVHGSSLTDRQRKAGRGEREAAAIIDATRKQAPFAEKNRLLDSGRGAAFHDLHRATRPRLLDPHASTSPGPRAVGRPRVATSVVAALALIAAVEAGVIAVLARALRVAPHPAIVVETAASGEKVLVSSRSTEAAPLQLSVAPDLRWVQLASPSSAGILGGKGTNTAAGTIRISSPIELKVFEDSRLLGSVPGAGLKLPAGRHDIELVNLALGYHLRQALDVEAGQTVSIHVAPPPGWVTIDAAPWAEVSIDGQAVGRTPLGPLPLTPGEHDLTFQHPAGVTDRQRVTVRSEATIRVIGNLRR